MSLEIVQGLHNSFIANSGNVSASNDPVQQPNDANELLIKGASAAAAGRELGLSEEETLAAVSRQFRRQRRADQNVTEKDVMRQMAQAAASVRSEVGTPEIKGVGYKDQDEVDAVFGKTDYEMGFRDLDADNGVDTSDPQPETRGIRRFRNRPDENMQNPVRPQEQSFYQPTVAPKSALVDALTRIQSGTSEYGYDAFPGSADAAGRLEEDVNLDRGADAALGAEAVRRDSRRFNPEMREYNDNRAEAESQSIAREYFGGYGSGSMADDSIGRIAEIRSLGKIGETAHVVRTANDAIQGQAARRHDGVFLDPVTNNPIAVQGPELPSVLAGDRTPNNGSSSDSLNAPQTAVSWVAESMPDYREGGRTFGDYPQVDITLQTTNFANKVRDYGKRYGIPGLGQTSANIRSVEELQKVSDFISKTSAAAGRGLTIPDPDNPGRSLAAGNRTVSGVMNAIGMTLGDQQQFANAMHQLDAARRSSVNQNPTGTYLSRTGGPTQGINFNAAEAINASEGQAKVARIPKGSTIRVGTTDTGKPQKESIVKLLSKLPSPSAQTPFMGAVVGADGKTEQPRVNRYNRTGQSEPEKIDATLRVQAEGRARRDKKPVDEASLRDRQVKAKLVQERENRDSRKREEQRRLIQEFTPANLRQRGRYS